VAATPHGTQPTATPAARAPGNGAVATADDLPF
jgi:hypothetical protein